MTKRMLTLFSVLQTVTARAGKTLQMTSGDRTCSYQRRVSTERNSYHTNGRAFDAVVVPYDAKLQAKLGGYAEQLGFRWGGNFKTGDYKHDVVHFDDGNRFPVGRC